VSNQESKLVALPVSGGTRFVGPIRSSLKIREEWVGGAFSLTDSTLAPRQIVPPHSHATDDQVTICVKGRIGIWVEGFDDVILEPGDMAFRPAGKPHAVYNPTDEDAHAVEITSPGKAYQAYMLLQSELRASGAATPEKLAEIALTAGVRSYPELARQLEERLRASEG
jgi:quercetin dioxygenase-like cupin family protein